MTKYAPYTSTAALTRAKSYLGKSAYSNMCQSFVVTMFGTGAVGDYDGDGDADAVDGWKKAKAKGRVVYADDINDYDDIPAGVAAYWTGGSHGYGHTAVTSGNGNIVSTDAGSSWGIVGEVDLGYISRVWGNGLKFVGYVTTEGNGYTLTDPPKEPAPKWFAAWTRNLGGMNDHGRETWDDRVGPIIQDIQDSPHYTGSIQCFQELANPTVADFDDRMGALGYTRAAGSDGRYIYIPKGVTKIGGGVFDLQPRYADDDKQAAYALLTIPAADPDLAREGKKAQALVVVPHLESDAEADDVRVGQMDDCIRQAEAVADKHGLGYNRILYIGDTNSKTWVRDKSVEPAGYVDAMCLAVDLANPNDYTYTGWDKPITSGSGIDYAFVSPKRPINYVGIRRANHELSDHLALCVVLGWGSQ